MARALPRGQLSASVWSLPEVVEVATRCDHADVASAALERLTEPTRAAGTNSALGIDARAQALVSAGTAADRLYRKAIERLGGTSPAFELARAHLLYGARLRRDRRRIDARDQLRLAPQMFTAMGARGVRRTRGA